VIQAEEERPVNSADLHRKGESTVAGSLPAAPSARSGRHRSLAAALFGTFALSLLAIAAPAAATLALIEIAVPMEDAAEELAIRRALVQALSRVQEGARAMGLPILHVMGASFGDGQLWVRVLASNETVADASATPTVRASAAPSSGGSRAGRPVQVTRPGPIARDPFPGE
jgi:hypothetical protein